jgi:hypothetical protein
MFLVGGKFLRWRQKSAVHIVQTDKAAAMHDVPAPRIQVNTVCIQDGTNLINAITEMKAKLNDGAPVLIADGARSRRTPTRGDARLLS